VSSHFQEKGKGARGAEINKRKSCELR